MTHPDIRLPAADADDAVDVESHSTLALVAGREPVANVFLPMLLFALAIVAWLAFVAIQEMNERAQLTAINAGLQTQDQEAIKLRGSFQSLAEATARLAAQGNPNARIVVDELRRHGIALKQEAGAASRPAAAPSAAKP